MPVCASTSLGFVQLRRVDKHKLPRVNSSQLDAAGHRPRKLVLAVVLQTARPQCSRLWSDRAVLISEICCPQVQNRGKLLSIWQLQFHLHLLLCYLDNNKHPLSHLQRDVDAVGFTVTGTVSGSWWPLELALGSAPTLMLSPGWGRKWLNNTQDENVFSCTHCRSPLTLTPPVSDPVTCSVKCRCEERPTHTCRVFPCFSGVAASCLTA